MQGNDQRMPPEPIVPTLGIAQYVATIRRRWLVVAAGLITGCVIGGVALLALPLTATATTVLKLNVISTEPFQAQKSAGGLLDDAAEAQIASSYAVAVNASKLLNGSVSAADIQANSMVTTTPGTSVVRVRYVASSNAAAVRRADAVSQAYLAYRSDQADLRVQSLLKGVNSSISDAQAGLTRAYGSIARAKPGSIAESQAKSERDQILASLADLAGRKNILNSVDTGGGNILTAAGNNAVTYGPRKTLILLTGGLAGLALGLIGAFAAQAVDPRVRTPFDAERLTDKPVLVCASEQTLPPTGGAAGQLRVARELLFAANDGRTRRTLIMDDSNGRDVAAAVLAFAVTIGQADHRTRLILPQITREQLDCVFTALSLVAEPSRGGRISVYESERVPLFAIYVPTDTQDELQADLLITRQVTELMGRPGEDGRDLIVLKSNAHEASILAALRLVDDIVVVQRADRSRAARTKAIMKDAANLGTTVAGIIFLSDKSKVPRETRLPRSVNHRSRHRRSPE